MEKHLIGLIAILFLFSPDIASAETYICTYKEFGAGGRKTIQENFTRSINGFNNEKNIEYVLTRETPAMILLNHAEPLGNWSAVSVVMISKLNGDFIKTYTVLRGSNYRRGTCDKID